jgi:hypothetical protein
MTLCRSFNVDWVAGHQSDAAGSDQGEHTGYFPGGFFEYSKDRLTLRFTTSAAQQGYCAACSVE